MSDIRANTISDTSGNGPINLHKQSAAKAYGTPSPSAALDYDTFNIASATNNDTGDITLNLTSGMSSAAYNVTTTVYAASVGYISNIATLSSTSLQMKSWDYAGTVVSTRATAQAHGDLA